MSLQAHLGEEWYELLKDEFDKEYFKNLRNILAVEYATQTVYPSKEDIFKAYRETPYSKVRVVIIAQDPYFTPGHAHGLAFSHPSHDPCLRTAPSLRNIFKELESDLGDEGFDALHDDDLTRWARQGVFLLNRSLTVREGKPDSHANIGWLSFTWKTIELITQKDNPVIFALWGNKAKLVKPLILPPHEYTESAHPSPLSCKGFFGTRPFSRINAFLVKHYNNKINWV